MNRNAFIRELREALKNDGNEAIVRENVRYYTEYIDDEVKKGRSEKEVIEELGDPWLIAKTISTTPGNQSGFQSYDGVNDEEVRADEEKKGRDQQIHVFDLNSKWKLILLILALVVILFLVFSIISGIISFLMPILGPLILIVIVAKLLSNKKK